MIWMVIIAFMGFIKQITSLGPHCSAGFSYVCEFQRGGWNGAEGHQRSPRPSHAQRHWTGSSAAMVPHITTSPRSTADLDASWPRSGTQSLELLATGGRGKRRKGVSVGISRDNAGIFWHMYSNQRDRWRISPRSAQEWVTKRPNPLPK